MNNTIQAHVEFDFSPYYDHSPSGIILSTIQNDITDTDSDYVMSDSATEMINLFSDWVDTHPDINWFLSTFTIKYTTDSLFAPIISIEMKYNDIYNLLHECGNKNYRSDIEISDLISQNIVGGWSVLKEVKEVILYLVNFYKKQIANTDDSK